jgi:hypothetical protein
MRDLAAVSGVVKLARVAIFDEVGRAPIGLALEGGAYLDVDALQELIARRTVAVK